jgi:hypothetical protein
MPQMRPSTFDYLSPSAEQIARMALMREAFAKMEDMIEVSVSPGRYKALAITALEQSAMWANKGVVHATNRESNEAPEAGLQAQPAQSEGQAA